MHVVQHVVLKPNTHDMTTLLLRRFEVTSDERARLVEQVRDHHGGSSQYLVQRGIELERLDARRSELGLLLRFVHGMHPNGPWPQPEEHCIMCGRDVGDNTDWLCHSYACKYDYPAKYEETNND